MSTARILSQTRRHTRALTAVVPAGVVLALLLMLLLPGLPAKASKALAGTATSCATTRNTSHAPASLATVAEAYTCVLAHYPSASGIDDRVLLRGAMTGIADYLVQQGFDQDNAVLPALTGNPGADWRAFAASYAAIAQRLPRVELRVQQGLAPAAIAGLVASLHDDHAHYVPAGASSFGRGTAPARVLGIRTSYVPSFSRAPRTPNAPPLFITYVGAGTAAARAGLRPGDIIRDIDGLPPYSGQTANDGVISLLDSGSILTWVPLLVFTFLFGLSMDYEVFILARMREEYDTTGSTDDAVVQGIGRTGRLVTSAALILFLAFTSLAAGPNVGVKIIGTGLGAGILLDATVVRMLLVPALVSLFGRWNWWLPHLPARLLRVEPSFIPVEVEEMEQRSA